MTSLNERLLPSLNKAIMSKLSPDKKELPQELLPYFIKDIDVVTIMGLTWTEFF